MRNAMRASPPRSAAKRHGRRNGDRMIISQLLISGLALGSIYALIAIGLVIVFKGSGVVNFAHGAMFTVAGFVGYALVSSGLPYALSLLVAVVATTTLGVIIERVAFRPLITTADPVVFIGATVACFFLITGVLRATFGQQGDYFAFPPVLSFAPLRVGGIMIPTQQLIVLAVALLCLIAFAGFFMATRFGKQMQAVAEDKEAASIVGINVSAVFMWIWGAGALLGGLAGILMAPVTMIYADLGMIILIKAFAAAVLGGFDNLFGAALGGFILGVAELLLGYYLGTQFQDVIGFVIIMLVLVLRPQGLFGSRNVARL